MIIVPTPSLPSCQRFVAEHALTGLKFTRIISIWQGFFGQFLQKILFLMSACSIASCDQRWRCWQQPFVPRWNGWSLAIRIAIAWHMLRIGGIARSIHSYFSVTISSRSTFRLLLVPFPMPAQWSVNICHDIGHFLTLTLRAKMQQIISPASPTRSDNPTHRIRTFQCGHCYHQ